MRSAQSQVYWLLHQIRKKMPKEFAKKVLSMNTVDQRLVEEAIEKLKNEIVYMEYARLTFNRAAQTQESIKSKRTMKRKNFC